ncbi:hypothetical protein [Clostridium sporogenes]|uniref:hypothetical protein n=1 Tax=Clostridium sporogenes TaxID=1509 RepID=UPI0013C80EBC|nr:hypothetical protein [Clostridium sporogenes]NFQ00882.1 hypothetical protein [Clostridium sporogenes]NFQ40945.1 hypothetical protein [Clostridium sporogenes]
MSNDKIEILKTASEYILRLKDGILKTSEYMESGEYDKGFSLIYPIAKGLSWLIEVIEKTKDIQKEEIFLDELNDKLNEINNAIENEDNVLIGDLFQYELLPIMENIEEIINESILN